MGLSADYGDYLFDLKYEIENLERENKQLKQENERLKITLKKYEWDNDSYCKICNKFAEDGHEPDCEHMRLRKEGENKHE